MDLACSCSHLSLVRTRFSAHPRPTVDEIRQILQASHAAGHLSGLESKIVGPIVHGAEAVLKWAFGAEPVYLFHNGIIRTMVSPTGTVEAILVHGDSIVATGSYQELKQHAPKGTEEIDLQGRTLLPGFVDPHMHLVPSALQTNWIDLGPQDLTHYTFSQVLGKLQAAVDAAPSKDHLILGKGFDPSLLTDGWRNLTVFDFDRLFPGKDAEHQNPILVSAGSGHLSFVNRRALKLAGLDPAGNPPPLQGGKVGTFMEGEHKGQLSGVVVELPGQRLLEKVLFKLPLNLTEAMATILPHLNELLRHALANGNTLLNDAGLGMALGPAAEREILKAAVMLDGRHIRLSSAMYVDEWVLPKAAGQMLSSRPQMSDPMFRTQAVKFFADGSNQGATGLQRTPYTPWTLDRTRNDYVGTDTIGNQDTDRQTLTQLIGAANRNGWQVMVHANGEAAIDHVLAAYAEARDRGELHRELRNRIEHCSILHDKQIDTMVDLGIYPSFLILHATRWGTVLKEMLGEERARLLDRCKSVHDKGLYFSLHSDYAVTDLKPLQRVQAAVTRATEPGNGSPLNPEERIDPGLALMSQTIFSAWQCHMDDLVGTLESGKKADLVLLEKDPVTCDPFQIEHIQVLETWVNGKRLFRHPSQQESP
jgi:predicted amidohydrolase YtcJ